jgi:endonuclease YncB( thermonuclease family)
VAILLGLGLLAGLGSSGGAEAASAGRFSYTGTVARVVDGDTLDVTLSHGKRERVRVIGIDTPERGACYFTQASRRTASLALGKRVVLRGDPTQDTRDRYSRLLAYVDIGGSQDLGVRLVREGYAAVYVFRRPFARLASYQAAAASAKSAKAGAHRACAVSAPKPAPAPAVPEPATGCHPSYSNCLPIVSDLDCPDVRALGKAPVQVSGADPYRLDADKDGLGCE